MIIIAISYHVDHLLWETYKTVLYSYLKLKMSSDDMIEDNWGKAIFYNETFGLSGRITVVKQELMFPTCKCSHGGVLHACRFSCNSGSICYDLHLLMGWIRV